MNEMLRSSSSNRRKTVELLMQDTSQTENCWIGYAYDSNLFSINLQALNNLIQGDSERWYLRYIPPNVWQKQGKETQLRTEFIYF